MSTLDGKLSALNIDDGGKEIWNVPTEPGPLLSSTIHHLEVILIIYLMAFLKIKNILYSLSFSILLIVIRKFSVNSYYTIFKWRSLQI